MEHDYNKDVQVIKRDDLEEFIKIYDEKFIEWYLKNLVEFHDSKKIMKYIVQREDFSLDIDIRVSMCGCDITNFIWWLIYEECDEHLITIRDYYKGTTKIDLLDIMKSTSVDENTLYVLLDILMKNPRDVIKKYKQIKELKSYKDKWVYRLFQSRYLALKYPDDFENDLKNYL